jgi:hypothetical protein
LGVNAALNFGAECVVGCKMINLMTGHNANWGGDYCGVFDNLTGRRVHNVDTENAKNPMSLGGNQTFHYKSGQCHDCGDLGNSTRAREGSDQGMQFSVQFGNYNCGSQ